MTFRHRPRRLKFLLLFFTLFLPRPSFSFSENNVREHSFHWMQTQTEHFDIYFDSSTELLVPRMAYFLEDAWNVVGRKFDVKVKDRTPFFFYSNHNEFEQTNIVPIGEGTGGVTEAFKNRLLIFNDGSETWLRHVIYHEFTHVVQFTVLYSGFWKSVRLLKSPFYPLWMMEGMAEVGAGDIDAPMGDMVVRDAVATKTLIHLPELQGFGHVKPNQVTLGYKTGEAAIQFLQSEYGPEKLHDLLVLMKDHFDISSALEELLGCDLDRFDFRFTEWLDDKYKPLFDRAKAPNFYGKELTFSDGIPQSNNSPVFSPKNNRLYFFSDKGGPTQIYEADFVTGKTKPIFPLKWMSVENYHVKGRSLSISPDETTLIFAGEKAQKDFLYTFDLKKRKLKKISLAFEEIRSPSFSPDGSKILCIGMVRGYNDLYLIDREGNILERLTNNPQHEQDPTFSPDGNSIIYSGEVVNAQTSQPEGTNLFRYSLSNKAVTQLTHFNGFESEPEISASGEIYFVRDRSDSGELGFNLYKLSASSQTTQLTDMIGGAFSPRISNNTLRYVGFYAGEKHIYEFSPTTNTVLGNSFDKKSLKTNDHDIADSDSEFSSKKNGSKYITKALTHWPTEIGSPLLRSPEKPYRFKASTDLFLPFFFYSTLDGLVFANIWQASDILGNHQLQQQFQYSSGSDFVDFAAFYTYARFRPQLTFGYSNQRYYRDFDRQQQRRNVTILGIITYPLDRINSISAGVGGHEEKDTFLDESEPNTETQERFWTAAYSFDTVTGRYLVPTKGQRLSLIYQQGINQHGGNQQYRTGLIEGVQYFPLPRESTFASRVFYGRSVGEEPQVFRLGGSDRVRGLPGESLGTKKSNVALGSAELRMRIKYLDWRTKFLFPDFFFKAAYLTLFDDYGYGWDTIEERREFSVARANNSVGVGISWPTFILQSYQIHLGIQWARRTDQDTQVWYITLGPTF